MRKFLVAIAAALTAMAPAAAIAQGTPDRNAKSAQNQADELRYNIEAVKYNADLGNPTALNQLAVWHYTGQHVPQDVDLAFRLWRKAAYMQNPKAISNLGVCYQYGTGVEKDSLKALHLYTTAISGGHTELLEQRAQNIGKNAFDGVLVGLCREKGIGTPADPAKAAETYAASAAMGSTDAAVAAARCYLQASNGQKALEYTALAPQSPEAQYIRGYVLFYGKGTKADIHKGIEHLRDAAKNGNADARNELAAILLRNQGGLSGEARQIAAWLKESARQGNALSMLVYAQMLKNGTGTRKDYDQALFWLAQAATAGYTDEFLQITGKAGDPFHHYAEGMKALGEGNFKSAEQAFKKAANAKAPDAKAMCAVMLAMDGNPKADTRKALKDLQKLSSSPLATFALARMYDEGTGIEPNPAKAVSLYQKAANGGCGKALDRLGDLYFEGIGVAADKDAAAEYYYQAYLSRRLGEKGASRLAEIYANGTSTLKPDPERALQISRYIPSDPVREALK